MDNQKPTTPGDAAAAVGSNGAASHQPATESSSSASATGAVQRPASGPAPGERGHRRSKFLPAVFLTLLVAVIGFGGGWLGAKTANDPNGSLTSQRVILGEQSNLISSIAKDVGRSVVSVNVTGQSAASDLYGLGGGSTEQQSAGTGIILSADGLIITNRHVVPEGTTSVSVVLSDGTELKNVEVIGRTSDNDSLDIAFLRIKDVGDHKLTPAKIGQSKDMRVGQSVVAIGNALGQFQNSVTTGIISGYGRSVQASDASGAVSENLEDLFQTDAAINQGNSGGPLVNTKGEVIGINTAVADQAENIGFAIPIDNVSGLIATVDKTGKLARPYLGVRYTPLTDALAKEFNLPVTRGAYIPTTEEYGQDTVVDGGPADKAGLKEGDIIVKIDGTSITDVVSLSSLLGKHMPGDKVELTVNRNNKNESIEVTLGTLPQTLR